MRYLFRCKFNLGSTYTFIYICTHMHTSISIFIQIYIYTYFFFHSFKRVFDLYDMPSTLLGIEYSVLNEKGIFYILIEFVV